MATIHYAWKYLRLGLYTVCASRIPPRPSEARGRLLVEWPEADPKLYCVGNNSCSIINSRNNKETTSSNNTDKHHSGMTCNGSSDDNTSVRNNINCRNSNSNNNITDASNCIYNGSDKNTTNAIVYSSNSNNVRNSNSSISYILVVLPICSLERVGTPFLCRGNEIPADLSKPYICPCTCDRQRQGTSETQCSRFVPQE